MQEILGLVRRCVTDYDMIQAGETVAVGVSAGFGSAAAAALSFRRPRRRVVRGTYV